jgi:uncharacterized protein YecE (DUF72 family)
MGKQDGNIHIGTSGWSYDHWKGPFYPEDLPGNRMLDYYTRHFRSVEINSSFYRLPEKKTLQHWYDCTPRDFLFTAKASRYITHMKKLREPKKTVPVFLDRISILGDKLGPILFQLPPHWRFNAERLRAFLESLSTEFRYAFEFRDRSWLNPHTYELLSRHAMSFCLYELEGFTTPEINTTDFVYVRLHGPGEAYQGSYRRKALCARAETFTEWVREGKSVWCYFDNDQCGYAARNADKLQGILSRQ